MERERKAIGAYLKLLQSKGAKSGLLYKRSLFLDHLAPLLANSTQYRVNYAKALDTLMKTVPAEEWHEGLLTAREFYPFWIEDIKAIAAFSAHSGYDVQPLQWKPAPSTLKSLTDQLKRYPYTVAELGVLSSYTNALQEKGADQVQIDTHVKLAKLLLIRLKDAPAKDNRIYRVAVDSTLPLFELDEIKQLFLFVVREFYYCWAEETKS